MAAPETETPNVLELKNVSKTFVNPDGKTFQAVHDINLAVRDEPGVGEFRVFLGPSGCGKSTILNIVAALFPPPTAVALLRGRPTTGPGPPPAMVIHSYTS